jgi:hypothetical protein
MAFRFVTKKTASWFGTVWLPPTRAEVQDVAARSAQCIQGILRAHLRSLDAAVQTVDAPDRRT